MRKNCNAKLANPNLNIVLVGFMGTGKTCVGKYLAKKLNLEFIDTDTIIEKKTKMRIKTIFKKFGEPYFRDIESKVAKEVGKLKNKVIATGGGIVIREENIENLKKNGILICLTAKPQIILERVSKTKKRPLLQGNKNEIIKKIKKILKERDNFYKKADFLIDTSYLTKKEVAEKIIHILSTT